MKLAERENGDFVFAEKDIFETLQEMNGMNY